MKVNQQLILLFVILVGPVFILNWYANTKTEQILKKLVTNAYIELNKQNHLLLNRDIDTIHRVMTTIIQNPQVQQMQASQEDALDRVKLYETTDKLISTFSMGLSGGGANYYYLFVYDPLNQYDFAPVSNSLYKSGGVYFYSDRSKPSWADDAISRKGRGYLKIIDGFGLTSESKTLAYIRAVNSATSGRAIVGVLIATNMEKRLVQSLQTVSLPDNGEIYLTDSNNVVLASTHSSLGETLALPAALGAKVDNDGMASVIEAGFIYVMQASPELNQKLVYRISTEALLKQQNEVKRAIQWISIAYSLFAIVVMAYFWRSLLTPLQRLAGFVRSYEPGRRVPEQDGAKRNDEVGVLIHSVHHLAHRLNSLIEERYVMDIKQKESQLRLLYQQINPHLLYNTLESIYWKSTLEGNSDSAEMIKELSKLMRISLSRGRELITLQEELEHATAYTNLQLKRYEYEFRVRWDVDPEAADALIPKITLQPLIENAIQHGVRNMGEDGLIVVNVRREGDRVIVEVADNGYQKVDFEWLNRIVREPSGESATGYGIHNVYERIQLHYGPEYGIFYSGTPGGGTTATIALPYQASDGQAE
ncbi:sensor histidine kinase [Cohnella fermenti]|uniref:histidine kinase n=2 Tax=Cohnella fermenti TaxID=2565925 RepID=A0A4S4BQW5_9BACL|nr:histidine kinase [Cohnella fermenti]THF77357.1 sensor histidine kinase [Cohnella fermenti]